MSHWNRAIIVGASSGIGEALAVRLAAEGTSVVLVARRQELLDSLAARINRGRTDSLATVQTCDVRDIELSESTFRQITEGSPEVDLVIYSSGVMPSGSREGYPTDEDVTAIETNFTGAVVWLNATAKYFEERGHGTIIGIGSIAGDRGRPGNPVYNATKAAMATYLEALRNRLARRGIVVLTAKPGLIRTPLFGNRKLPIPAASADSAAACILKAAQAKRRVAYVPPVWMLAAVVLKTMPAAIMERVRL